MLNKRILTLIFVVAFVTLLVGCLPQPTNQVPVITSIPITAVDVGETYTYDVNATDPDGDTLVYLLVVKPSGMTINSANGVISWTPTSAQIGDNAVIVLVSDDDLSVTQNFTIVVSKPSYPPFPTKKYTITATADPGGSINPSGNVIVNKGSNKTFTITPDAPFFRIVDVLVDGGSVGAVSSYPFTNVTADHTIEATFVLIGSVYNQTKDTHHDTIQDAINGADSDNTILVMAGTYEGFTVDGKTDLTIQSSSAVIVEGTQSVTTNYGNRDCVVFVKDSSNIVLDDLDIEGSGLGLVNAKNYGIIYENSTGEINDCIVSPNTIGDMLSIAIGVWDDSDVIVDYCIIEDFGRVGVFVYNGCVASVLNSTIVGQVYGGEGELCYGIEVEGAYDDATPDTGSQVTITGNEIYNFDNTFDPEPTWQSGGVYINGWLEYYNEEDSTVIVENNDIHDNYSGIIVIKSLLSYAHFNNIYNNRVFGVDCLPAYDTSTAIFDAEANWWGIGGTGSDAGKPGEEGNNGVSAFVDYIPWSTSPY